MKLTIKQRRIVQSIFALLSEGSMTRNDWVNHATREIARLTTRVSRIAVNRYVRRMEQTKRFRDWVSGCNIKRSIVNQGIVYSV